MIPSPFLLRLLRDRILLIILKTYPRSWNSADLNHLLPNSYPHARSHNLYQKKQKKSTTTRETSNLYSMYY